MAGRVQGQVRRGHSAKQEGDASFGGLGASLRPLGDQVCDQWHRPKNVPRCCFLRIPHSSQSTDECPRLVTRRNRQQQKTSMKPRKSKATAPCCRSTLRLGAVMGRDEYPSSKTHENGRRGFGVVVIVVWMEPPQTRCRAVPAAASCEEAFLPC